jgi:glycosyltransferase involved in cell wall biosynthesis
MQNSIGLIVYYSALELCRNVEIALYGRHYRDDVMPGDLPFEVRSIPVLRDRILQKIIREYPRVARWLRLDGKADDHSQYRRGVRRLLASDHPDLIHVMNYWPWCRELKALGAHKLVLEMQCEWLSQRDRGSVALQLEAVDAVVAVSDHIASTFRAAFPQYPGIVATVGNGVDVSHFRPRTMSRAPLARSKRIILFVGRVSPEKGIHSLIKAFAEVAARFDDVELRIAGPQATLPLDFINSLSSDPRVAGLSRFYDRWGRCTYQEHLEELITRHGLRDRVRFVGSVSHKDLVTTYQEADILVNPSLSESFGISVVEAMACGIPVVGTRVGGMCESVLSGTTGMLVEADAPGELAQALIAVLDDPVRACSMGIEGRKRAVTLYSWQARAERLMSVYRRVGAGNQMPVLVTS